MKSIQPDFVVASRWVGVTLLCVACAGLGQAAEPLSRREAAGAFPAARADGAGPREPASDARRLMLYVKIGSGAEAPPAGGKRWSGNPSAARPLIQRVQTLEGEKVSLSVGQSLPLRLQESIWSPQQGWVNTEQTRYLDIGRGFDALARVQGDWAVVTLSPYASEPVGNMPRQGAGGPPLVEKRFLSTTVKARVGMWVDIAGESRSEPHQNTNGGLYYDSRSSQENRVWLKVEVLD